MTKTRVFRAGHRCGTGFGSAFALVPSKLHRRSDWLRVTVIRPGVPNQVLSLAFNFVERGFKTVCKRHRTRTHASGIPDMTAAWQ
jgi:hypothetical protein